MKLWLWLLILAALLCGCKKTEKTAAATVPVSAAAEAETLALPAETEAVAAEAAALAQLPEPAVSVLLQPAASGEQEVRCDGAVIDYSHTGDGYVMARCDGAAGKRLKVLMKGPGTTYSYNLPPERWTVFPLSDGNGSYQVGIYENTTGTKYAAVLAAEMEVTLADEFAPFLRPNQYVDYTDAPRTLEQAAALCAGIGQPLDKVAAVYDFVVGNLSYDQEKARSVQSGYLPVLDEVLEEKKGICFDYAALMSAMLRSQQIPCKLVVGYAGSTYHAWISVWTEETGWVDGAIFFDGHAWKRMDPTFASSGERSSEIMAFIETGTYTAKYLY